MTLNGFKSSWRSMVLYLALFSSLRRNLKKNYHAVRRRRYICTLPMYLSISDPKTPALWAPLSGGYTGYFSGSSTFVFEFGCFSTLDVMKKGNVDVESGHATRLPPQRSLHDGLGGVDCLILYTCMTSKRWKTLLLSPFIRKADSFRFFPFLYCSVDAF